MSAIIVEKKSLKNSMYVNLGRSASAISAMHADAPLYQKRMCVIPEASCNRTLQLWETIII